MCARCLAKKYPRLHHVLHGAVYKMRDAAVSFRVTGEARMRAHNFGCPCAKNLANGSPKRSVSVKWRTQSITDSPGATDANSATNQTRAWLGTVCCC